MLDDKKPAAMARGGLHGDSSRLTGSDAVENSAAAPRQQAPLATALGLARRGWAVIPLRPDAKTPDISNWPNAATGDEATIRGWFEPPAGDDGRNVGAYCGGPGFVLDIDVKAGPPDDGTYCAGDPHETARRRLAAFCKGRDLPPTWTVRTPSGGMHLYFRKPQGAAASRRIGAAVGVDLLAGPSYAVAPGSTLLSAEGAARRYEWLPGHSYDDMPLANAPDWLMAEAAPRSGASSPGAERKPPRVRPGMSPERAEELYRGWLRGEAPEAVEGSRGRAATIQVIHQGYAFGCGSAAIFEILLEDGGWNETKAIPAWEAEELESLIYGLLDSRQDEIGKSYKMSGAELKKYLHEAFGAVHLENPSDEGPREKAENASGKFRPLADFVREFKPVRYTIAGILRSSSLYALTAPTGHGKTAFNVAAALAVATGRNDILGRDVSRGRVIYLSFENPEDVQMRFIAAAHYLKIDVADIGRDILILDARRKPERIIDELRAIALEKPLTLVVADTLAAWFDGDNSNDATQGGGFMRRLRPLCQLNGNPTVLVSAHPVKNATEDRLIPYGSGAILNEIDGNLTLYKKADGAVWLHWQGKLRGAEFEPAAFTFEGVTAPALVDDKGALVPNVVLTPSDGAATEGREADEGDALRAVLRSVGEHPLRSQRDSAAACGVSVSTFNARLRRLEREGLVTQALGRWSITPKGRKALLTPPARCGVEEALGPVFEGGQNRRSGPNTH